MKSPARKCGTCRFLRPRSDGKPFYHAHTYKCEWNPPEIVWPASVREGSHNDARPYLRSPGTHMKPGDGTDCPCWEPKAAGL